MASLAYSFYALCAFLWLKIFFVTGLDRKTLNLYYGRTLS